MIAVGDLLLPALLVLLAAVPASFMLAMRGARGAKVAAAMLFTAIVVNIVLPFLMPYEEFVEIGAMIALLIAILSPLPIIAGWHFGNFMRERRQTMPKSGIA